jgi:CRP/FNR family transcriptional regulator, cyclic AMP receptor protein
VSAPPELVRGVPLFADLDKRELEGLASTMKERTFNAGHTIASEGQTGIGFFVIAEGTAKVTQGGEERATLGPGDYFGEIALLDDGMRTASVVAASTLKAYGLTSWEFRPLVEGNASIAWKLLKTMAKRLREAEGR